MDLNVLKMKNSTAARANAVHALRSLYEGAEGRELTPDERRSEGELEATIKECDADMARALSALENANRPVSDLERSAAFGAEDRAVLDSWQARGSLPLSAEEFRTLTAANVGSSLIPKEHAPKIIENVVRASRVAGLAQRFEAHGNAYVFPTVTANPVASVIAEGQTITPSDPTYTPVEAEVVKSAILTQVGLESWEDTSPSVRESLSRQHLSAHARLWDSLLLTGSGSGEPQGVIGTAGVNTVTAGAAPDLEIVRAAISAAEAEGLDPDALHFAMPPAVWAALEGAVDLNERYLLGDPRSATTRAVFGVPVVLTDALPVDGGAGSNEATIVLADWSYLGLAVRHEARIEASTEFAFDKGLVTVRSMFRMGSAVLAPEAFQVVDGLTV